jgi:hypothetical protein
MPIDLHITYHPAQNEIFWGNKAKLKVIPKGRRFGLTKGYANFTIENLLDGVSPILWVDTVQGNIESYFQIYFMPHLLKLPLSYWSWDKQRKKLNIMDRYCDFRSAERPEFIEGFSYRLMLLNEAGIILRDRYLWENTLKPMTLDYNPDVIIGGTPKGGGLFEELFIKAKDNPERAWAKSFTTYDNPFLKKASIDLLASEMPETVRDQEIFGKFISDRGSVFKRIQESLGAMPLPHWQPGRAYYMGVDLAKHVDWTVIVVIDDTGKMVYFNRFNKLDWEYQQRVIIEAAKLYRAKVLIDSTGVGDPVFDALRSKGLGLDGLKITNESKKRLIEGLMLAFETTRIKIFDDQVLKDELRLFSYSVTASGLLHYEAPEGYHDDCVIALALAWSCFDSMKPQSGFAFSEKSIY